jgi:hypothetical protein
MDEPVVVYHRRKPAAKFIRDKYAQPVTDSLLAKLAIYGGGPPFRKIGGEAIYEEGDLDLWAKGRIGPKVHSTAELTVGRTKSKGRPPAKKGERRIPPIAAPVETERISQSRNRAARKAEPVAP